MKEPTKHMQTPLERARLAKGVSKAEAARGCGTNRAWYGRVESGESTPSPELASAIAKYFGSAVTRDQVIYPKDYATAEALPTAMQVTQ